MDDTNNVAEYVDILNEVCLAEQQQVDNVEHPLADCINPVYAISDDEFYHHIANEPNIDYCAAKSVVFVQNLSAASGATPTLSRAEGEGPRAPLVRRDPEEAAQEAYDEFIRAELGEAAAKQAAEMARRSVEEYNRVLEERSPPQATPTLKHQSMVTESAEDNKQAELSQTRGMLAPLLTGQTLQVVTAQMPERYDGVSDLRIWDSYFDTWDENAGKKDFAADREMMLQLFDLIRPDEALEKFHALSWDGKGHVSQFMAILKRALEEYDKMLPAEGKLPPLVKSRMLLDRLIACAPEGARPVLRRRRPKGITEICQIIEDYRGKQSRTAKHAAAAVPEDKHACPGAVAQPSPDKDKQLASLIESQTKAINAMHTSQNALLGSLKDILKAQQDPGRKDKDMRAGPTQPRRQLMPCGLCEGKHASYNCPHKKFSEGCNICGSKAHLSRSCPERSALLEKIKKGVTPEQGN
ncbi:hypothetical protein Pmar_PMAR011924 [Perkinsus marinus ATCC 50983]|uniref:CCHC-type domain-containing protein n=1 Tax=Perkinsus marinus (strain ATCC 50983 / TXsc) TaxID=423536 RepID=C5LBP7_PERM5|nr:hypothetical protein Pmar_PMAR011924 [Perkinsus marinus ATCC 50983]EER05868.1 hypothetical protein Pmar_PMAR011924 [Perkinsus marinus ATCC 50983]|eukprot:XP_002774052.1 hypothetical protein Pmar_PMAR011924 [Perkinsus marinus ATCC 50983]